MLQSPIEEVKNRLDIVQVVGEYLKLQKAGANFRALCPFHAEKGPSFFVTPARQMWHCFGCGIGGSVFDFVMHIEGLEFGDALRLLAQKAGVELPKRSPAFVQQETERKRLLEITELAARFFEKQLSSKAGAAAKEYLQKRGVSNESFAAWRIGYAPGTKRSMLDFLVQQGYREQEIGRAGLLVRGEQGVFDRFRSRIMFPVFNLQGEVMGFGGRIFGKEDKDMAKYVNTPNTPLYDKGRILYGLDKAKLEVRKQDSCVLVEGYMDAILVSQAGTKNVVATSGTALTSFHLQLLRRYSENLVLAFDMDIAGDTATKRGIELSMAEGFLVKIVRLTEGKDPAEAAHNPESWHLALDRATSIIDYYFESTFSSFNKRTLDGKSKAASLLLSVIFKLPNKIVQSHWIQRLAEELGVREEAVREELAKVKAEPRLQRTNAPFALSAREKKGRRELIEERILVLVFCDPGNLKQLKEEDVRQMSLTMQEIVAGLQQAENLEFSSLEQVFSQTNLQTVRHAALLAELEKGEEELKDEFSLCLKSLAIFSLKGRLEEIMREIKKAEGEQELSRIDLLLREFQEIAKELTVPPTP
ncbi:MAG: DNA primase [Candidatus Wildermuthbacteria bacterium RIFCSPHIGHO2_01_FULL_49_22b]|uniref:DNA primase n=1 Tax=Candidatus Wildermuthbacteria bacterium RIFCSPHIGHO2_01_FULL_49_22b TaxID=1802448 RepID=A0A1G2QZE6_9BACT|nr:MAG: DNA primase [Candidatus Wildermuthbacteria bacterium RIFCSPHIGHO2_01_FULL_49_22b]